ncbi:MAG TPA: DegQ family serine endoprotease [bacterium]
MKLTFTRSIVPLCVGAAGAVLLVFACHAADGVAPAQPQPPPPSAEATAPARALGDALAAVAEYVRPAVVSVYSEKILKVRQPDFGLPFDDEFLRRFFGEQGPSPHGGGREFKVPQRGMGSGMIIDREGHILTNNHVVADVDELKVQLADKRQFVAKVVSVDPKTDVAVIRLQGPLPANLPTVQLGDSDALRVGELVMAIGAPFGLTQTVTSGIISARGRSDVGVASYEDFLQTDTAINPGNSGGPLVNMRGEVIGMNSAIAGSAGQFAGVGFAIPANMIKTILPTLTRGGRVTRGQIGVVIQDLSKDLAEQFGLGDTAGALVSQVVKGSPAERGGVEVGDVIVRVDGRPVTDTRSLRNTVAATAPGTRIKLEVLRGKREHTLSVTVEAQPAEATASASRPGEKGEDPLDKLGLEVQTLTAEMAQQLGLKDTRGVLVTDVAEGSPAAQANLQQGDVIIEANRTRVADVEALRRLLRGEPGKGILLLIHRQGTSVFVVLRQP